MFRRPSLIGMIGGQFRAPLQPPATLLSRCLRGFRGVHIFPHNAESPERLTAVEFLHETANLNSGGNIFPIRSTRSSLSMRGRTELHLWAYWRRNRRIASTTDPVSPSKYYSESLVSVIRNEETQGPLTKYLPMRKVIKLTFYGKCIKYL